MRIAKVEETEKDLLSVVADTLVSVRKTKVKLGGREFYRFEIIFYIVNVVEVNIEKFGGGIKTVHVVILRGVRPGETFYPLPRQGLRSLCTGHIHNLINLNLRLCKCMMCM